MKALFGRGGLPAEVRRSLDLGRRERVLALASTTDGDYVVATDRAVHLPGPGGYERLPWERVENAEWYEAGLRLRVLGDRRLRTQVVEAPGALPEVVRERVRATIVVSERARLAGDRGVLVVGRRRPGGDELSWSLVFDRGLDPDDPRVRAAAEDALRLVREQTGA